MVIGLAPRLPRMFPQDPAGVPPEVPQRFPQRFPPLRESPRFHQSFPRRIPPENQTHQATSLQVGSAGVAKRKQLFEINASRK